MVQFFAHKPNFDLSIEINKISASYIATICPEISTCRVHWFECFFCGFLCRLCFWKFLKRPERHFNHPQTKKKYIKTATNQIALCNASILCASAFVCARCTYMLCATMFKIIFKKNAELRKQSEEDIVYLRVLCVCCVRTHSILFFIPWMSQNRSPQSNSINNVLLSTVEKPKFSCICLNSVWLQIVVPSILRPNSIAKNKLSSIQSKPIAEWISNWMWRMLVSDHSHNCLCCASLVPILLLVVFLFFVSSSLNWFLSLLLFSLICQLNFRWDHWCVVCFC